MERPSRHADRRRGRSEGPELSLANAALSRTQVIDADLSAVAPPQPATKLAPTTTRSGNPLTDRESAGWHRRVSAGYGSGAASSGQLPSPLLSAMRTRKLWSLPRSSPESADSSRSSTAVAASRAAASRVRPSSEIWTM